MFWADRAKEVVSVESDSAWFGYISGISPSNLRLMLQPDKELYVSNIRQQGRKFDVIVIDGQWRNACANVVADYLMDYGMIIFDNSDRHYQGCDILRQKGFFQIDFSGFSPINGYTSTTSLFIRASTQLQLKFTPSMPIGGLAQLASKDD